MLTSGLHDVPPGKLATVITHLEMHNPPPPRGVAAPVGVALRQVAPDLAWYRDIFDRVGARWLWFGRRKLDDAALAAILHDPAVALFTLTKDGRDEALMELDFRRTGECELAYFGVTEALIGTGSGRFLMEQALRIAWTHAITRLHLHTCTTDSQQALPFYIRSGFTPYHRQIEIGEDPRLTDLLPEDAAPHVPLGS